MVRVDNFKRTTKPRPLITRIAEKVDRVPGQCWLWTGALNKKDTGYPVVGVGGGSKRLIYVHRFMYELFHGPIPHGWEVDHICEVPQCVNPSHLQAVTPRRNKALRGERITHCKRGHKYTKANTAYRKRKGNGVRSCRACHRDNERARRAAA